MRPRKVLPAVTLVLSFMRSESCAVPQPQEKMRFLAEEAAYNEEITPLVTAACQVGRINTAQYIVATGLEVPGYGAAEGSRPWSELYAQLETLLPPQGLEGLHGALVATLASQMNLAEDSPSQVPLELGSKLPEIDSSLNAYAQDACSKYNIFVDAAGLRRPLTASASLSPNISVSFQPTGSPFSFGVNSKGSLSVSVAESIATPLGSVTISASESTASPTSPRRLVVQAGGHRRVLLLDRPFKVFVPSDYGVSVANDGLQITLTVESPGQDAVPSEDWILWTPGTEHPQQSNVIASSTPNVWNPAPGYDWVDASAVNDMRVAWKPGTQNPDYEHVIASEEEGFWQAEKGWKWKSDIQNDFSVVPK